MGVLHHRYTNAESGALAPTLVHTDSSRGEGSTAEYVSGFAGCFGCEERTRRLWLVLVMGTLRDGAAIDPIAADANPDNGALGVGDREATSRLGMAEAAVRKRVQRGSLGKEMSRDGRVYLDLSRDMSRPESQVHRDPVVEELRNRVASPERSLERWSLEAERYQQIAAGPTQINDQLSARVLEVETPVPSSTLSQTSEEAAQALAEAASAPCCCSGDPSKAQGLSEGVPWWRRMFGG